MLPNIYIFGQSFGTYGIMVLIGVLISGFYVCQVAKKRGHDNNDYIIFLLVAAIGVLVGGHIMYAITKSPALIEFLTNLPLYSQDFDEFIKNVAYIFGGSVFYGGLLGGIAAGMIYGNIKKYDMREYSDICAPMIPLFHCFGRLGCFLGGCCYGIESDFGFTAHGNELVPSINDVQRFPVQLLEAFLNILLFIFLAYLLNKKLCKGKLLGIYLLSYSVIRFFDEFLRGDEYRGYMFGLSTSQIISILIFICTLAYFVVTFIKNKKKRTA